MLEPRALARRISTLDSRRYHVVTLPDFFLDHFVRAPPWSDCMPRWQAVHDRGGGNVATPGQHLGPGGNAANTALALARLGVRTHLITRTSPFGKVYLDQTLGRAGVDLHHVKADGQLAVTTALEFQDEHPRNVMLSDPGSVAEFGPETLDANDWTLIEAADLVLVANWAQNRRGSDLLEAVVKVAAQGGRRTMVDTGDPSVRGGAVSDLRKRILPLEGLTHYALNENELTQLDGGELPTPKDQQEAARRLQQEGGGASFDLHTASYSASYDGREETIVPTFAVKPQRVTGAGDAWNAGNILGHLAGFDAEARLTLANAVAAFYISGEDGTSPNLTDLVRWLETDPTFVP